MCLPTHLRFEKLKTKQKQKTLLFTKHTRRKHSTFQSKRNSSGGSYKFHGIVPMA